MIFYALLTVSIILNIFFVWYVRELLIRFNFYAENISLFKEMITNYREHLSTVYQLETFYGDSTLGGLLTHTKDLTKDIEEFGEQFDLEKE